MKNKTSQSGFTLIELIAVMVILGILAAVIIPRISTLTSGAYESNVRSMHGLIKNEVNAQALKAAMTGGASGHMEKYPEAVAFTNFVTNGNKYLKEWVEDYDADYWVQLSLDDGYANGNFVADAHEESNAILFGYFPHGILNSVAGVVVGGTSTNLEDIYWIYYAPHTTVGGNTGGRDFDGFYIAAFKDDGDGTFDAAIANAAAASSAVITANGEEELTDLTWTTPN